MISVPDIQSIRQLRERTHSPGVSFLPEDRHQISSANRNDRSPQYVRRNPAPAPQMDPYQAVIESWLRQDAEMPLPN